VSVNPVGNTVAAEADGGAPNVTATVVNNAKTTVMVARRPRPDRFIYIPLLMGGGSTH
jgi:hypothetical protein